jgi:hypothetical protein
LDPLNGCLAIYAGGVLLIRRQIYRGWIAIWRRILEADFIMRPIPGAGLHREEDFGGGFTYRG